VPETSRSHVILGVHGLSRKPPKDQHGGDWCQAIQEGLTRNYGLDLGSDQVGLDLVYWADWLGREAYGEGEDTEPYAPAPGSGPLPAYRDRWYDQVVVDLLDHVADPIDWAKSQEPIEWLRRYVGLDEIAARFLQSRLVDLGTYYGDAGQRALLREKLQGALLAHQDKRIMVIAHSMGSIVAYDVLRSLGKDLPGLTVNHFVTIGSPLGMPYVLHKIRQENTSVRTPSIVRRWTNLSDRRDPVAVDVHLADEFEPNDRAVAVEDRLIINTYQAPGRRPNHHKIYGYLRAPEMSQLIREFI
jgi:pimeloyl-ACP methyl ester carboxylesterase